MKVLIEIERSALLNRDVTALLDQLEQVIAAVQAEGLHTAITQAVPAAPVAAPVYAAPAAVPGGMALPGMGAAPTNHVPVVPAGVALPAAPVAAPGVDPNLLQTVLAMAEGFIARYGAAACQDTVNHFATSAGQPAGTTVAGLSPTALNGLYAYLQSEKQQNG